MFEFCHRWDAVSRFPSYVAIVVEPVPILSTYFRYLPNHPRLHGIHWDSFDLHFQIRLEVRWSPTIFIGECTLAHSFYLYCSMLSPGGNSVLRARWLTSVYQFPETLPDLFHERGRSCRSNLCLINISICALRRKIPLPEKYEYHNWRHS